MPLPHSACPPVASPRDAARLRPSTSTIAAPHLPARGVLIGGAHPAVRARRCSRGPSPSSTSTALWHDALGRSDVFWGQLRAKLTMFAIFFFAFLLIAGLNLYFADRAAPQQFPANVHPYVERFHEVFGQRLRFIRYAHGGGAGLHPGAAGGVALAGLAAVPQQRLVRCARPAVPRRRRLLRVRAAVHLVRDRLAVRGAGHRAAADDGGTPAQRRRAVHLVDAHRAAGDARSTSRCCWRCSRPSRRPTTG